MGDLEKFRFDLKSCQAELNRFGDLIFSKDALEEQKEILPFFNENRHLLASIASYHPRVSRFDRVAREFRLFEKFRTDAVVGDSKNNAYCFIEFEGANSDSIFVKKDTRKTLVWGDKLTEGLTQIIDWFWTLDVNMGSDDFDDKFKSRKINYMGLLVIGRDKFLLEDQEKKRWFWFQDSLLINSRRVMCMTYDQLYNDLQSRLNMYHLKEEVSITVDETGAPPYTI